MIKVEVSVTSRAEGQGSTLTETLIIPEYHKKQNIILFYYALFLIKKQQQTHHRTKHGLTLLLEITHCACNLPVQ